MQSQISSKKRVHKQSKKDMDDENDEDYMSDWHSENGGSDNDKLFLTERIVDGSFMPAIVALEKGILTLDEPIDDVSGLTVLHYACLYGNIKALRYIFQNCSKNFKLQVQDFD